MVNKNPNLKYECPICFAPLKINDEKMVTCPYCDALLYNVEGTLKLVSSYPWWQKKDPSFEEYKKQYGASGMIRAGDILELYVFKDDSWFLIFNNVIYKKKAEQSSEPDKYDKKIEAKVSYIYGRIPVFTPLNFQTVIYSNNNWIIKKEVFNYTLFERVQ
ncbi:MAG: hypothetical protein QXH07_00020 [Thermoplasmata archaeon]